MWRVHIQARTLVGQPSVHVLWEDQLVAALLSGREDKAIEIRRPIYAALTSGNDRTVTYLPPNCIFTFRPATLSRRRVAHIRILLT